MRLTVGVKIWTSLCAVLLVLLAVAAISYENTRKLLEAASLRGHTHEVLTKLTELLSTLQDAETGQRGFLITGEERYLEPYQAALQNIDPVIRQIRELTADNP